MRAQQEVIDNCSRQVPVLIRRAYQITGRQLGANTYIPTGLQYGPEEHPARHIKQTQANESSNPWSQSQTMDHMMDLQGVKGDVRCRIFPATLANAAHQCYFKLAPRKFNSWNSFMSEFYAQFSSSRQVLTHLEYLIEVKQILGEPLRAYINRFMNEAAKVKGLTKEGRLASILRGIEPLGELWKGIKRLTVG
uniref:Retrotransposon gag domain-containing protein n=1 Tax=Cannabis sativa TaxID=3483 RepID=A0A803NKF2_CANSA